MWKHMNNSDDDNNDEIFFDDLFGSSAEECNEVAEKVSEDSFPAEIKNEKICKTSYPKDKEQQDYYKELERRASEYVDHDLIDLELSTFKEGWIDGKGKLKKSEQKNMVDYRMELELLGGSAVEIGKKRNKQKNKKKRKKSARRMEKDRQFLKNCSRREVCHYFAEGKCKKGNECQFVHLLPTKLKKLCKFYLNDQCTLGKTCNYMHSEFPCKYYHTGARCFADKDCRFSHAPLTKEMEEVLHAHLNPPRVTYMKPDPAVKRECILGVPPKELRQAEATVEWREEMELLQPKNDRFFVEVPPVEEKAEILSSTFPRPKFYQDTFLDSPSPPASPQICNLSTPLNFNGTPTSEIPLGDSKNFPKLSHSLTSKEHSSVDVNSKHELQNSFQRSTPGLNLSTPLNFYGTVATEIPHWDSKTLPAYSLALSLKEPCLFDINSKHDQNSLAKPTKEEVENAPEWIGNVSPTINLALQSSTLQTQRTQTKEEHEKNFKTKENSETSPVIIRVSAVEAEQTRIVHIDACKNIMQESVPISPKTIDQEMTSAQESGSVGSGRNVPRTSQSSKIQIKSTGVKEKSGENFQIKENKRGMKTNCKLKKNAKLQAFNNKTKQLEEMKKNSLIPWDNPNLLIPKWPKLTDMLIEIDLKIMSKGNYSACQINKRKHFHKKLLSAKYDDKKFVKSLPTDIRLMEPSPTPWRKLKPTSPVKDVEMQRNISLTLENDISTSGEEKYFPCAKTSDQTKESINFTMNAGTVKPVAKVECNKTPVYHPCVNYSENNKQTEAKLPPTRELLLKYKANQSSSSPKLLNEGVKSSSLAQNTAN